VTKKIAVLPVTASAPRSSPRGEGAGVPAPRLQGEAENDRAPVGGGGYEAAGHPLPRIRSSLPSAAMRFCSAPGGPQLGKTGSAPCDPSKGCSACAASCQLFAICARDSLSALASASTLKPEVVSGLDYHDHPRTHRRHLFRKRAASRPWPADCARVSTP